MAERRKVKANYDFYSGFAYYVPGLKGMSALLALLAAGAFVGSFIAAIIMAFVPGEAGMEYGTLISYPIMFIPPMIYARNHSSRNEMFDPGVSVDSANFGKLGGIILALLVMVATVALGFVLDLINAAMPPMPAWLEEALGSMTGGTLWINFLCVSIFAPFFEEWLCRGEVLRGLLNYERTLPDGTKTKGMEPKYAIMISALFFAVIHLNPWQGIPAFLMGCLFGYVYYKTGSIKLTMLMHFTNNTLALLVSQVDAWEDYETWNQMLGWPVYIGVVILSAIFLYWFVGILKKIPLNQPQGNCDQLEQE